MLTCCTPVQPAGGLSCRQLLTSKGRRLGIKHGWQLVSEALLVKYSCLLALPLLAGLRGSAQMVLRGGSLQQSLRAMAAHHSQWVWCVTLATLHTQEVLAFCCRAESIREAHRAL